MIPFYPPPPRVYRDYIGAGTQFVERTGDEEVFPGGLCPFASLREKKISHEETKNTKTG